MVLDYEEQLETLRVKLRRVTITEEQENMRMTWAEICKFTGMQQSLFLALSSVRVRSDATLSDLVEGTYKQQQKEAPAPKTIHVQISKMKSKLREHAAPFLIISHGNRGYSLEVRTDG